MHVSHCEYTCKLLNITYFDRSSTLFWTSLLVLCALMTIPAYFFLYLAMMIVAYSSYYVKDGHSAAGTCAGAAMSAGENSYIGHLLVLGRARKRLTSWQKRIMMSCQSLPKCRIAADSETAKLTISGTVLAAGAKQLPGCWQTLRHGFCHRSLIWQLGGHGGRYFLRAPLPSFMLGLGWNLYTIFKTFTCHFVTFYWSDGFETLLKTHCCSHCQILEDAIMATSNEADLHHAFAPPSSLLTEDERSKMAEVMSKPLFGVHIF